MKILVTGATGFIGSALIRRLLQDREHNIIAAVRGKSTSLENNIRFVTIPNIDSKTDWAEALSGVDAVIHTAAVAHVIGKEQSERSKFREVNSLGTINLAEQAAKAGVKRFIFISSIAVNGAYTEKNKHFTADDQPNPTTAYGISKYEAEEAIQQISARTGMEFVIIRPPLVYGAGAKGNFATMLKLTKTNLPLPFASLTNKRSLVGIDNIIDFIKICVTNPKARNQIFLVSDGNDITTAQLIKLISHAIGKNIVLLPCPLLPIKAILLLIGQKDVSQRIFEPIIIDITKNWQLLGWKPPFTIYDGIKKAVTNC